MADAILITLEMAKWQLKETGSLRDAEITQRMAQAEDVILRYLKPKLTDEDRPDWPWTIDNVPPAVQSAILLELANLDRNRGDALQDQQDAECWQAIANLLMQLRDKALA